MTPAEIQVLDHVREVVATFGWSPTMTEIAKRQGFSRPRATKVVNGLVDQGYLMRASGKHRSLILAKVPDLRGVSSARLRAELGRRGEVFDALAKPETVNWGRHAVTCAVDYCHVEVKPGMLMCRTHWFRLPLSLQGDIKMAFGRKDEEAYGHFVTEARDFIDRCRAA